MLEQKIYPPASLSSDNRTPSVAKFSNSEASKKNSDSNSRGSSHFVPTRKYKVYPDAVIRAIRTGYTKQYAFFFLLRRFYQNGKIYENNSRKIAERTGISVYLVKKYMKDLEFCKLTYQQDGKIMLVSNKALQPLLDYKRYLHIEIRPGDSLKDVELNIKSIAVKFMATKQIYVAQCRRDKQKWDGSDMHVDLKKYKKVVRTLNRTKTSGISEPNAILSARYLKRVAKINCGDFKAFREFTSSRHGWVWNTGTCFISTRQKVGICRSMWPSVELNKSKECDLRIYYIPSIVYNIHSNTCPSH